VAAVAEVVVAEAEGVVDSAAADSVEAGMVVEARG
jgi:hypothetical protein